MDDNTTFVLIMATLLGSLAACYITGAITDYLEHRASRELRDGAADLTALRRDLRSAEDELARLRRQNAELHAQVAAAGVYARNIS